MNKPGKSLAIALDNMDSMPGILSIVEQTSEHADTYKIGLEQFIRFGPGIIQDVRKHAESSGGRSKGIFLDLKLMDIPNTVYMAVKAASAHGADYLTVHTSGGGEMLEAAAEAAERSGDLKILGVTVLTSISESILNNELNIPGPVPEQVQRLYRLALKKGLDGIVCSASDLTSFRREVNPGFEIVTPGIRLADDLKDDQKRTATPLQAIRSGATMIVAGRAVTAANNPKKSAEIFINQIKEGSI